MNTIEKIGQKLVFGFDGTTVPDSFVRLVETYKIGNVILFRRNIASCAQLRDLCACLQQLILDKTGHPAFITIDQEGGMVSRLTRDAVNVPGCMALTATGNTKNAYEAARITARQLKGVGVNFNLAPDLDVNCNAQNPVIGVRSFGDDAAQVAAFGAETVRGYRAENVLCCGKHFPGHGDTAVDSHLGLPVIDKDMETLEKTELVPFRAAIAAGIPAIMSSHILFPQIEKAKIPATMSSTIMTGLLRKTLGFDGLILSDCMTMNAIQSYYGTDKGVAAAMKAGIDLVFVSENTDLQEASAKEALRAAQAGEIADLDASCARIFAAKEKYAYTAACPELAGRQEDREKALDMAFQACTWAGGTCFTADAHTIFYGCEDYRTSNAANVNGNSDAFPMVMQRAFGGLGLVTGYKPGKAEIENAVAACRGYDKIVLGTCNAHLFTGQIDLANALADTGKPLIVVTLRNPYDLPLLPQRAGKLAVWDYSSDSMQATIRVLQGEKAPGHLPVCLEGLL